MMKKPPGYSEAPISEVYVYNGKDWVLTSGGPVTYSSVPDDEVFDSSGLAIGGDWYEESPPDHALSRRPDDTYQPAPTGSHYRYDKTNHSWTLEGDGGSPIPMTDPTDKQYYIYDSNGVQVLAVGIPSSSNQPTTQTTTAVATSSSTSEAPTTATATATPSTSNSNPPPTETETTSSNTTSSYAPGQTGPTDSHRVYSSGYMMRKPPGYSEAPISEVYVYNGKDWVLSSGWSANNSWFDDWTWDSSGEAIGGNENNLLSDHALSRRPDKTYQPAPSGSHYRYDKANHSWTLEGDGGSPIPTTDPTDVSYVVYDSNGNKVWP
jgi:phage baseplate assembly protein gpV